MDDDPGDCCECRYCNPGALDSYYHNEYCKCYTCKINYYWVLKDVWTDLETRKARHIKNALAGIGRLV